MNRPKKKKNADPLLPEKDDVVDERHLVDVEDSAEISFEDRVNIYWMENKGFVIGCIVVLFLAVVGFQGARLLMQHNQAALQQDFLEASKSETLPEFAEANAGTELGGFAALDVADAAFAGEDYAEALKFYELAAEGLDGTLLEGRALLGRAFANFYNGNEAEALSQLNAIAADAELPQASRAEAAYHLAVEADVAGRDEDFESYVAMLEANERAGQWARRIEAYTQQNRQ